MRLFPPFPTRKGVLKSVPLEHRCPLLAATMTRDTSFQKGTWWQCTQVLMELSSFFCHIPDPCFLGHDRAMEI